MRGGNLRAREGGALRGGGGRPGCWCRSAPLLLLLLLLLLRLEPLPAPGALPAPPRFPSPHGEVARRGEGEFF